MHNRKLKTVYSLLTSFILFFIMSLFAYAGTNNTTGEKIFKENCTTCHSTSMAPLMKAPVEQSAAAWKPFVKIAIQEATKNKASDCAALTKSSSDTSKLSISDDDIQKLTIAEKACYLLPIAKTGRVTNGAIMPPMGNCINCKDADLKAGIEYMLTNKK